MATDAEILHGTRSLHLLGCVEKLAQIAIILRNSPYCLACVDVGCVPLYEFLGRRHVFGYGLLGENMLARQEGLFDELRLCEDWQSFTNISFFFSLLLSSY